VDADAPRPDRGPLAALVALLEGTHLAPPEHLSGAVAEAGRALGVGLRVYLVDYEQVQLHPVPGSGAGSDSLAVDTTMAGRAFQMVEILASEADDRSRLWVPLLDGVERLGVIEVELADRADDSAELRAQCRWVSSLIGHLVVAVSAYGDGLDAVRRTRPRSPAAELVWQLLPATTAGTGAIEVAGATEPSYRVGGDVFDHALSATTAHLAVFDATGHSLHSGLAASAAVAAYRSTRRNRGDLAAQARAVDETLAEVATSAARFVTAVLAELDLASGRLRYVVAGHPPPLLMRDGRIVKTLRGGSRPLFGLSEQPDSVRGAVDVGEEPLEPGDWLMLYTDGITEARDSSGGFFGDDRLVDFLRREAASGHPPPETARRLIRAVLDHQDGVLQDDATVLLARWRGRPPRPVPLL
jgi:serine phosphatase RsbU (regulator of sigma subunit)